MPTLTVSLNNIVLRPDFLKTLTTLLGSRAIAKPDSWLWAFWQVVNPEGLEYQMDTTATHGYLPKDSYFDGSRTAAILIRNSSASTALYEFALDLQDGRGECKVMAPEPEVREWAEQVAESLAAYIVLPEHPPLPPFKVFIGHGGDGQWEYLERTLRAQGYEVENFEADDRAGYHTLVVIEKIIRSSAVAVIVMTGEDTMGDGALRARENVVHEVGFAQGLLGIENTIILLEEGVSEPSNIQGLTQIRFRRGRLIDAEERILRSLNKRREAYDYENL